MSIKDDNPGPADRSLSRCPCEGQVIRSASGPAGAYVATELATAPPGRLRQTLVDAVVRRCREALDALDADDAEAARSQLDRARRLLRQLRDTLGAAADDETRRALKLYSRADGMLIEAGHYTRRRTVLDTLDLLASRRSVLTSPTARAEKPCAWLA